MVVVCCGRVVVEVTVSVTGGAVVVVVLVARVKVPRVVVEVRVAEKV